MGDVGWAKGKRALITQVKSSIVKLGIKTLKLYFSTMFVGTDSLTKSCQVR